MKIWRVIIVLLLAAPIGVKAQDHLTSKLTTQSGQTLVLAEGEDEARSIGSFSVRLCEAAAASDETTFFVAGLIRARDGIVEKAILADIDGDKRNRSSLLCDPQVRAAISQLMHFQSLKTHWTFI